MAENIFLFVTLNGKDTVLMLTNEDKKTLVTFPNGEEYELKKWETGEAGDFLLLKGYPEKLRVARA
jgi:hypothetical protein